MLRVFCLLPFIIVIAPLVIIGTALLLTFQGSPGACGNGRPLAANASLADQYSQQWTAFERQLSAGRAATLTVSDDEATARLRQFLSGNRAPVKNARLCFVNGGAEVSGDISAPFGGDVAVRVRGSVDLSGAHPQTHIDSIRIGGLPSFVTGPFRGLVTRIIDHQSRQVTLDHSVAVQLSDGKATLSGGR
ncbi:MAG TPA: hypothetical protein VEZ14_06180 [Dehalococcoidia bacterium]|nr:hypothetical protein [Dehalococcoidia bacterium]